MNSSEKCEVAVDTKCRTIGEAIQKLAQQAGYSNFSSYTREQIYSGYRFHFDTNSKKILTDYDGNRITDIQSLDEVFKILYPNPPQPRLMIGSYNVSVVDHIVHIGCQRISKETVKEIWEKLQ